MIKQLVRLTILAGAGVLAYGQIFIDRSMLTKIRAEETANSQVAPVFDMLTINIGPRLTASPAHKRAAEWARDRLASYGLEGARLEPWKFGRGWSMEKVTVEMIEPRYLPLIGYADAWSPSTNGEIVATPVFAGGKSPEEIDRTRAQYKGAIVMTQPIMTNFVRKDRPQPSDPDYVSLSAGYATGIGQQRPSGPTAAQRVVQILGEAGAGVLLKPSIGEHGTVFVTGRDLGPGAAPSITLAAEHYNMIVRMLEHKVPVKLRINVQTKYYDADNGNAYNVLAELPGTDPELRDQVVMLGGHLDCWHTGVGATDNADGATTVMEAMRILKAIDARPRRTIRVALWGGEEQGLLGSRAWVQQHLSGAANAQARDKFDVYFNIDNGTNAIYGWFLQNNEAAKPMFDTWLEPLKEYGARRNVIEPVGATDHLSFVNAGVPGFNPIQDYKNYDIRTHHTNMDMVERVDLNEVRQASVAMAWFVYNAAMMEQKVPRPVTK
ncbi:MAG TPA: M20/M25/M40 family metallo-hydrolase [Bryobacteraceae bacterium]|nr:M20/M25/M40 family metallo-hydrolase [Bryobacteraceae bacterium]